MPELREQIESVLRCRHMPECSIICKHPIVKRVVKAHYRAYEDGAIDYGEFCNILTETLQCDPMECKMYERV